MFVYLHIFIDFGSTEVLQYQLPIFQTFDWKLKKTGKFNLEIKFAFKNFSNNEKRPIFRKLFGNEALETKL